LGQSAGDFGGQLILFAKQALWAHRPNRFLVQLHDHQFGVVKCTAYLAYIHLLRWEWQSAFDVAEEASAVTRAFGFVQLRTLADSHKGVALVRLGQAEMGNRLVQQTLVIIRALWCDGGNQAVYQVTNSVHEQREPMLYRVRAGEIDRAPENHS